MSPAAACLTPGTPIAWTHYYPDGRRVRRTGVVLDRAPGLVASRWQDGAKLVWWVQPDEALPGDLYALLAVGRSGARSTPVRGRFTQGAAPGQVAGKGELYPSGHPDSPTGRLVMQALREMRSYAERRDGRRDRRRPA